MKEIMVQELSTEGSFVGVNMQAFLENQGIHTAYMKEKLPIFKFLNIEK